MTWEEVRSAMITEFGAQPLDSPDSVALTHEGQLITVSKIEWGSTRPVGLLEFTLLLGDAGELDARNALARNGEMALGAFVERSGALWWRHATPLETLDVFEAQLALAFARGIASLMATSSEAELVNFGNTGTMWH